MSRKHAFGTRALQAEEGGSRILRGPGSGAKSPWGPSGALF